VPLIVPSILSAAFDRLGEEVRDVTRDGADWIHVDVMDGHFVPNITMGPGVVRAVRKVTRLPIDAHLMISNPDSYIKEFADAGATHISVHVEATTHLHRSLQLIRGCGAQAGIALGPAAPLSVLEWSLDYADYILLLGVNPGFGGQELQPVILEKIHHLRALLDRREKHIPIQTDGGVNTSTIADFAAAGVDIFVVGSCIFGSRDYSRTIATLRAEADRGLRTRVAPAPRS
jgi:ribulose-phosphate 3-epimerase